MGITIGDSSELEESVEAPLWAAYEDAINQLDSTFLKKRLLKTWSTAESSGLFLTDAKRIITQHYHWVFAFRLLAVIASFGLLLLIDYIRQRTQHDKNFWWNGPEPFLDVSNKRQAAMNKIESVKTHQLGEPNQEASLYQFFKKTPDMMRLVVDYLDPQSTHALRSSCRLFYLLFRRDEQLIFYTNPDVHYSRTFPILFDSDSHYERGEAYAFSSEGRVFYSKKQTESDVIYDEDNNEIFRFPKQSERITNIIMQALGKQVVVLQFCSNTDKTHYEQMHIVHFNNEGNVVFDRKLTTEQEPFHFRELTPNTHLHSGITIQPYNNAMQVNFKQRPLFSYQVNDENALFHSSSQLAEHLLAHQVSQNALFLPDSGRAYNVYTKETFPLYDYIPPKITLKRSKQSTVTCVAASKRGHVVGLYYLKDSINFFIFERKDKQVAACRIYLYKRLRKGAPNPNSLDIYNSETFKYIPKPHYQRDRITISKDGRYAAVIIEQIQVIIVDLVQPRVIKKFRTTPQRALRENKTNDGRIRNFFETAITKHDLKQSTLTVEEIAYTTIKDFRFDENNKLIISFVSLPCDFYEQKLPTCEGHGYKQYIRYSFFNPDVKSWTEKNQKLINSHATTIDKNIFKY